MAAGTDPTLYDTDGDEDDTKSDAYELSVGRDPLWEDKLVAFDYTGMLITADCDGGTAGGDFYGVLLVEAAPGHFVELVIGYCLPSFCGTGVCEGVEEGSALPARLRGTARLCLNTAGTFRAWSSTIVDCDGITCADLDGDSLSFFDQTFSFGDWDRAEWTLSDSTDPSGCEVTFYASITTD